METKMRRRKRMKKIPMMKDINLMQEMNKNQVMLAMNPMENMNMNYMGHMNMNAMYYPNIFQNMGYMDLKMIGSNLNFLNGIEANNMNGFRNKNFKTVKIFYQNNFVHNVDIYEYDDYSSIAKKVKSILYESGIKLYRKPFRDEVVERTSPLETLEFLLERGVIDNNPRIIINHYGKKYPNISYEYHYLENGNIFNVEFEGRIYGGGGLGQLEFIDVDELAKPKNLKFSKTAPKWRKVSKGLNLFGKCINKKCEAYNEEVIYNSGINIKFDFNSDRKEIKCPICSKNFIPMTMGFWKCEYQIKGEKLKNGDYEEVDINGKETKGDNFEYYDPYKNSTTYWSNLMIFTGHRQKMKYRKYSL